MQLADNILARLIKSPLHSNVYPFFLRNSITTCLKKHLTPPLNNLHNINGGLHAIASDNKFIAGDGPELSPVYMKFRSIEL